MADITAGSVKSKKKKKISIFPIVNCIIMVLFVIITLYPVLNTLAWNLPLTKKVYLEELYNGFAKK